MIQSVRNNYNINFKAAKVKKVPNNKMPEQVRKLVLLASNTSDLRKYINALNEHGIRLTGYNIDKNIKNKVHICYNIDNVVTDCEPGTLTVGAVGQINTLQDARTLLFDTIKEAWKFFLENASDYSFHR